MPHRFFRKFYLLPYWHPPKIEGVLLEFTGSKVGITNDKGEYKFDVSEANIKTMNMRSGDELLIYYEGELKGTDTSKVKVTSVEDLGNNNENKEEKQAVGTLVDISMNTITIKQNDGRLLTFFSNNCKHDFKNGLREGNWIVVTYIGEIQGDNTQNVAVIKITDNDENKIEKTRKEMPIKAVDETVYATAGVHIRASYSTTSDIIGSLTKGETVRRTGVCDNGWSRIIYNNQDAYIYGDYLTTEKPAKETGTSETPQKTKEPIPEQKPDSYAENQHQRATGTVIDATMNTVTIETDDGAVLTFDKSNADENVGDIQIGTRVDITVDMTASAPQENILAAKEIKESVKRD